MAHLGSKSIIIVPVLLIATEAARILGVFPYPSYSHQVIFRSFTTELARRGHELIVFTTDPANDPTLQNYTEVDLHSFYDDTVKNMNFFSKVQLGFWSFIGDVYRYSEKISDGTLSHPVMQRFISPNSTEKFDLIIVQSIFFDALYALSIRFDAPLIGVVSSSLMSFHHYIFGNPLMSACSPNIFTSFSNNMNLWQRFVNLYYNLRQIIVYQYISMPLQERISRKHFGNSVPPAHQLASHMSLLLIYSHPFFIYPHPNVPAIIPISRNHLTRQKNRLPPDLEKILNDATEGYIYFSLGSNVKSNLLPVEKRDVLLRTFARLPYKVLWKFESDHLANKSPNVVIRKWLLQQEVLAHPNIRLFIYQGGLQSTEEAIENGVPVIGLPILADQFYILNKLQNSGAGKILNIIDINEEKFREAILEVITNSSYKENMMKMRDLLRDLPYDPMENTIWWIEHIIRHKGAPHLRNKSRDMPWYQVQLLDIMGIMLVATVLVFYIVITITRNAFKFSKQLIQKKKMNFARDSKKQR